MSDGLKKFLNAVKNIIETVCLILIIIAFGKWWESTVWHIIYETFSKK